MNFLITLISKTCIFIFSRISPHSRWKVGGFIAWLWWDVFKLRRMTVYRNLRIVFPDKPKSEIKRIAKVSIQHLATNFVEFCALPTMDMEFANKNVIFHDRDRYEKLIAEGKGVLLISLHVGNGDIAIGMMGLTGMKINVISKIFKNEAANNFWFGVRQRWGTKFLDPHGTKTAFEILKAIKRNEAVIFVTDQFMGKPYGISSTFFGKQTGTAYGLALFALKTGAPVLPVYTYRDDQQKIHIAFDEVIKLDEGVDGPDVDRDLQIAKMTEQYNRCLEKIILRHPDQWMWVHRRWKKWE